MEHRQLGRSGLRVSRLALGTMTWGGHTGAAEAAEQLAVFRDAGGTLVDTAATYQDGASEQLLGDLLGSTDRDDLVLASKAGGPRGPRAVDGGSSRAALLHTLDRSLRRLGVEHLDLWQVQGFDPEVPLEETLSALDTAVARGKVRYTGVGDHSGWQLATAASGPHPLAAHQLEYSLVERGAEREVVPAARHHGIGLLARAPLGRGVLTGKYRHGTPPDSRGADPRSAAYVEHHRTERASRIVQATFTAAEGLGTSPVAVALAWARDRPGVTAPVLGARTSTQLTAALAAEDVRLPPAIQSALDDVSAPAASYPERVGG